MIAPGMDYAATRRFVADLNQQMHDKGLPWEVSAYIDTYNGRLLELKLLPKPTPKPSHPEWETGGRATWDSGQERAGY